MTPSIPSIETLIAIVEKLPLNYCDMVIKAANKRKDYINKQALSCKEIYLITNNKKIKAIKSLRDRTGLNLIDCKLLVDSFIVNLRASNENST